MDIKENTFIGCAGHHSFNYHCHACLVSSLGRLSDIVSETQHHIEELENSGDYFPGKKKKRN